MKTVRMSDDTHRRLVEYADGRPLGKAVERLLDTINSVRHATKNKTWLTHAEVFGDPDPDPEGPPQADTTEPPPDSVRGKAIVFPGQPTTGYERALRQGRDALIAGQAAKPLCTCGQEPHAEDCLARER